MYVLIVTTPTSRITLGCLNWPMMDASDIKSSVFLIVEPCCWIQKRDTFFTWQPLWKLIAFKYITQKFWLQKHWHDTDNFVGLCLIFYINNPAFHFWGSSPCSGASYKMSDQRQRSRCSPTQLYSEQHILLFPFPSCTMSRYHRDTTLQQGHHPTTGPFSKLLDVR